MLVENRNYKSRNLMLFAILIFGAIAILILNIAIGSVKIHPYDVLKIILGKVDKGNTYYRIVYFSRIPRTGASFLGGASLAVSGLLLQIFFRNPIVDSYVLGISSGSTLFVALVSLGGITFGIGTMSPYFIFIGAFLGALIVMFLIMSFAYRVKSVVTLLIIGLMIGYLCSAISGVLLTFADQEKIKIFTMWTLGSFSGFTLEKLKILAIISIPVLFIVFVLSKPLNSFLLGENYAKSMGVNIQLFRIFIIFTASILTSVVTAFSGPVAFIGLAVPHMTRLIFKTSNNRVLIPGTILTGGIITSFCDLIARSIFAPTQLAISTVTSVFGVPIVIFLLLRRKTEL